MLYYITVLTHEDRYFRALQQTANKNKIHIKILGLGEKWLGFGWKLKKIFDHISTGLKNNEYKLTDVFCLFDGFDTIFNGKATEILNTYKKLCTKHEFLISLEQEPTFLEHIVYGSGRNNKLINGGGWIASGKSVMKILNNCHSLPNDLDDQVYFTKLHRLGIIGDDNMEIFYHMKYSDQIPIQPIVSFPACGNMNPILIRNGIQPIDISMKTKSKYYIKYILHILYLFICGCFRIINTSLRKFVIQNLVFITVNILISFNWVSYLKYTPKLKKQSRVETAVSVITVGYGHLTQAKMAIEKGIIPTPKCIIIIDREPDAYIQSMFFGIPIENVYSSETKFIYKDDKLDTFKYIYNVFMLYLKFSHTDAEKYINVLNKYNIGHVTSFFSPLPTIVHHKIKNHITLSNISTQYNKIINPKYDDVIYLGKWYEIIAYLSFFKFWHHTGLNLAIDFEKSENSDILSPLVNESKTSKNKKGVLVYMRDGIGINKVCDALIDAGIETTVFTTSKNINSKCLIYKPNRKEFADAMAHSSALITTGGIETIIEATKHDIPILTIPCENDIEQFWNSYYTSTIFKNVYYGGYDIENAYGTSLDNFIDKIKNM